MWTTRTLFFLLGIHLIGVSADIFATTFASPYTDGSGTVPTDPVSSLADAFKKVASGEKILLLKGSGSEHRFYTKSSGTRGDGHESASSSAINSGSGTFASQDTNADYYNACAHINWASPVIIAPQYSGTDTYAANVKAVVSWWDLNFSCVIGEDAQLEFQDIEFTGQHILQNNCDGTSDSAIHKCSHCHMSDSMNGSQSATGTDVSSLLPNLKYSSSGPCKDYLTKVKDIALFVLKGKNSKLTFTRCNFKHFRARTHSVIHIYRGALVLTEVNFSYIEPGSNSMTVHEDKEAYQVHGIITSSVATISEVSCSSPGPCPKTYSEDYACLWSTTSLNDNDPAKLCTDTTLTWNTGTVQYLNHDHNFAKDTDQSASFYPFMDLMLLSSVSLTSVNFYDNIIPMTKKELRSVIQIYKVGQVTITSCEFKRNLAPAGILRMGASKEYANSLVAAAITVTGSTFEQNDSMFGGVLSIDETTSGVTVTIQSTNFLKNISLYSEEQTSSALVVTGPVEASDTSTSGDTWVNSITKTSTVLTTNMLLTVESCKFKSNFASRGAVADILASRLTHVKLKDLTVEGSKPYSTRTVSDKNLYELLKNNARMNFNIPCKSATTPTNIVCTTPVDTAITSDPSIDKSGGSTNFSEMKTRGTLNMENSRFESNSVSSGPVMYFETSSDDMLLENFTMTSVTFSGNSFDQSAGGGALYVRANLASTVIMTFTKCIFSSNTPAIQGGVAGGGMYLLASKGATTVQLDSCTFTGNKAGSYAAAYIKSHSLILNSCVITSNITTGEGATLYYEASSVTTSAKFSAKLCTFDSNNTGVTGTDIYITGAANKGGLTVTITSNTFTNSVTKIGGVIVISGVSLDLSTAGADISNCTISGASLGAGTGVLELGYKSGITQFRNSKVSNVNASEGTSLLKTSVTNTSSYASLSGLEVTKCTGLQGIYLKGAVNVRMASCTFTSNSGSVISNYGGTFTDNSSTFTKNTDDNGSVYFGETKGIGTFTGSTFQSNTAEMSGTLAIKGEGTELTLSKVTAKDNSSGNFGGLLYCKENAKFTASDSTFTFNKALKGSALFFVVNSSVVSTISNSVLSYNSGEGVIYLLESILNVVNCTISSNKVNSDGDFSPALFGITSTMSTSNCTFYNQSADNGAFVVAQLGASYTDSGSTFDSGTVRYYGGMMYLMKANATLTDSVIKNINGMYAGAFFAFNYANIWLNGTTMKNITSVEGAIILQSSSTLSVNSSSLSDFNSTVISSEQSTVSLTNSTISNSYNAEFGGVVFCDSCVGLTLKNNTFSNVSATYQGGCLYLTGSSTPVYSLSSNTFYKCSSLDGGAIYADGVSFTLSSNNFTANNATGTTLDSSTGHGGAMQLTCSAKDCVVNMTLNTFNGNEAHSNGGAVNWDDVEPLTITNNDYVNNSAAYGPDYACFASYAEVQSASRRLSQSFSDIASGQETNALVLLLKDKYGNTVFTDNDTSASLAVDTGVVGGTTSEYAENGVITFSAFSVKYDPGSSVNVVVDIPSITLSSGSYNLSVPASLRYCISGEIETSDKSCTRCPVNQYSIADNSTICNACPSSATCDGGADMYPNSGYWRSSETTDVFFSCLLTTACTGNDNKASKTGVCDTGYESNLCQSCQKNWSRTSKNTCGRCPDSAINALRLTGIAVAVVCVVVIMVRSTLKSAAKPKELHSVYIKILTNYLQLVLLVSSFNLNWPSLVESLLSTQESAGSATDQLFSFDCYLDGNSTGTDVFYQKLVIIGMLPVVIVILASCYWLPVAAYRSQPQVLRSQLVSTIIVLLFLVHPSIVQTMFKSFSCMEIDPGEQWLLEDLALECWKGDHSFFVMAVGLPGLLLWGLGIPTLALVLLIRNRRQLRSVEVKTKYGFLYIGYKHSNFYWELVILYRKIAIAFTSVFLSSISTEIQALTVMIVILVAFNLQLRYMPYENLELNLLETRAIVVAGITIYCGLYFLTNDLSENVKIVLFVLILVSNIYFLVSWVFGISSTFLEKLAKKKPYLVKKFCGCIPSLSLAADIAIREQEGELYYGYSANVVPLVVEDNSKGDLSIMTEDFTENLRNIRSPTEFFHMMIKNSAKAYPPSA
jgi:hypothetical protein